MAPIPYQWLVRMPYLTPFATSPSLKCAQIRRHKGDASDPMEERTPREQEVSRGFHLALQEIPCNQHRYEVADDDAKIDDSKMQEHGHDRSLWFSNSLVGGQLAGLPVFAESLAIPQSGAQISHVVSPSSLSGDSVNQQ